MCKTFIQKKIRKNKLYYLKEIFVRTMPLLKGILLTTTDEKGMNTSYSLLLKAGGLVIYRVFNGEAFDFTIEAIEDSELLLLTASAREELMNALPF
jgi:hypothetical protein